MIEERLWTRSFVIVTLVNFLGSMNFQLLMTVMAKFAADRFGASTALAGLSASIFIIGALVSRPVAGKWLHRLGQTKTLSLGTILCLALTLLYFAANGTGLLLVIRFLHGAAYGSTTVATGAIVADIVPRGRYGEGIGYFTLGGTLATAIGPFAGLLLVQHGNFNAIIITGVVVAALGTVILPLMSVKDLELTEEQVQESKGFRLGNLIEPKVVPVVLAVLLTYLCYSSVASFIALYSQEIGLTSAAGFFFIVYAVVVFVTRPFAGRRFDSKGENAVMYPAILIFALSLAIYSQARQGFVLLLAAAVMGMGFGAIASSGRAITAKITPLHRMGLATSTFYIFADFGVGIGPLLCGILIPYTGYRGLYVAMAVVTALSLVLYYALHGRRARVGAAG